MMAFGVEIILDISFPFATELAGGKSPTPDQMELRLVQSKEDLESPPPISSLFTQT